MDAKHKWCSLPQPNMVVITAKSTLGRPYKTNKTHLNNNY